MQINSFIKIFNVYKTPKTEKDAIEFINDIFNKVVLYNYEDDYLYINGEKWKLAGLQSHSLIPALSNSPAKTNSGIDCSTIEIDLSKKDIIMRLITWSVCNYQFSSQTVP